MSSAIPISPEKSFQITNSESVRFSALLLAADNAVDVCLRRRRRLNADVNIAETMIDTIVALTGATRPDSADPRELVHWLVGAVTESRTRAVQHAVFHNLAPSIDANKVEACLELVSKLNKILG